VRLRSGVERERKGGEFSHLFRMGSAGSKAKGLIETHLLLDKWSHRLFTLSIEREDEETEKSRG